MTLARRAALAALGGGTLALAAPPLGFWPGVFVAAACFGSSIDGARWPHALATGWLTGSVASALALYWVIPTVVRFTDVAWPLAAAAYLALILAAGLPLGCAALLVSVCGPVLGFVASIALAVLVAERYVPAVFPWQFAAPLIDAPWLPQAAELLGVSGLSALVVGSMVPFARVLSACAARAPAPPARPIASAACLLLMATLFGAWRGVVAESDAARAPTIGVALVQAAAEPPAGSATRDAQEVLGQLWAASQTATTANVELVVWPEAAYPFLLPHREGRDGAAAPPIAPFPNAPTMLVGAMTEDTLGRRYNSAVLRRTDATLAMPAAKQTLLAFGEYLPLLGGIRWIRGTFARAGGLTPGTQPAVFALSRGRRLGVLNCFEDTLPQAGARLSNVALLVNITNDAWFGRSAASRQHLMLARWRAIEMRRELVRAVNTGVTCRVDALGRVVGELPRFVPATLRVRARLLGGEHNARWAIVAGPPAALIVLAGAALLRAVRAVAARSA